MRSSVSKLLLRILTIIGISLLSLLVLFYVFVQLPVGRNLLKNILEDTLSETLQSEVSIGSLNTNLLSCISIKNISLKSTTTESSSFDIGSVIVRYNLLSLLRNRIDISSAKIDALTATIFRDEKGRILLPQPKRSGKTSSDSLQISLKSLKLSESSILYYDQNIPLEGNIHDLIIATTHSPYDSTYSVTVHAGEAGALYEDEQFSLEDFLLKGSYKDQTVHVDSLSFSADSMLVMGNAEVVLRDENKMHGKLEVQGDPGKLIRKFDKFIPQELQSMRTDFTLVLSVDGSIHEPELHARISFPELMIEGVELQNGKIEAYLKKDSIHVHDLYCEIFDGSLSAQGGLTFGSGIYDVGLTLSEIEYKQLWEYLYKSNSPYRATLSGNFTASGEMNSILSSYLEGQIKLGNIRYKNKYIKPLVCAISYNNADAECNITHDLSVITSNFHLHDSRIHGSASLNIENIEYFAGLFNLTNAKGELYAQADFDGEVHNPSIQAHIKGSGLSYMDIPVDSLYAEVSYEDNTLSVQKSSFIGTIESLDPLTHTLIGEDIRGQAQYSGYVEGSLDDFSGSLTISADSLIYQDFSIPAVTLECHAINSDIIIDLVHIETEKLGCRAEGEMSLSDGKGNLLLDFEQLRTPENPHLGSLQSNFEIADSISFDAQLHELSLEILGAVSDSLAGIQGFISGLLSFKGGLNNPNGSLQLTVDKPAYKDFFIDMISLHGTLTPDEFILKNGMMKLFNNDIRFRGKLGFEHVDGTIVVNKNSKVSGEISMSEVALKDYAEEFLDVVHAKGILTSTVQLNGTLRVPKITGSLRAKDGFVQLDTHKSPIEQLNTLLIFSDSTLKINTCTGLYEGKSFSITGGVSSQDWHSFSPNLALAINNTRAVTVNGIYQPEDMDITVQADTFDVSFAEIVPAIMNAQGYLNASVDIKGSLKSPCITGWMKASAMEILPQNISKPLTKCTLDISATNERLDITKCSCSFGDGNITTSGFINYQNNTINDIALNLEAENISLEENKKYRIHVNNCDLNYTQQKTGYTIDGTVVLGKTKYLQDFQISKILDDMRKPKIFKMPTPIMTQTKLNVRLTDSKDLWIENNLARIKIKADVSVIGTLAQPNIAGRLEITDGYIVYLDRKFEITTGTIDFTDPNTINPILDIQAETDIKNYIEPDSEPYHITLTISGAVDQAVVTIQSDPTLDEANILSLLTFGTKRDQIFSQTPDKYSTSLKDILLERAEQYSSQKISGFVAGKMAKVFDLDDVTIEGNLFDFGNSWGPQLVASKQLSKRMKVTYSTRVGYLNEQNIELDYKLTDHLYLQGQADQEGSSGVDVIYRLNFK